MNTRIIPEKPKPSPAFQAMQIPGAIIMQNSKAQGASSATEALYNYVVEHYNVKHLRVLELGSGSGVLALMLANKFPTWQISGIEIQPKLHQLAEQNAISAKAQVKFIQADLRSWVSENSFDLIISNPPWQAIGSGLISPNVERAISRSEVLCSMAEVLACSSVNIAAGKDAILLYPVSRQTEFCSQATGAGFSILHTEAADSGSLIFHLRKG